MRLYKLASAINICLILTGALSSCSNNRIIPDYASAELFETALNKDEDTIGKTVCFVADTIRPNSAFGFNIWAGEHLNFISDKDPGVKEKDSVTVKVNEVKNLFGSWMITYELIYIK